MAAASRSARRITTRCAWIASRPRRRQIATRAASSARLGPAPADSETTAATPRPWTALVEPGFFGASAIALPVGVAAPRAGAVAIWAKSWPSGPDSSSLAGLARQKPRLGDRSAVAGGALTAAGTRKVLGILIDRRRTGHRGCP